MTGQRWNASDILEADEGELENMRIPSGEGVILEPKTDARYVADLPLDEVGAKLATLIREIDAEDEDED